MRNAAPRSITSDWRGLAYRPGFSQSGLNHADAAAWRVTHCAARCSNIPQAVEALASAIPEIRRADASVKRRQAVPVHEFPALLPAGNMVEIGGYVMQYRYAKPVTPRMNCTK